MADGGLMVENPRAASSSLPRGELAGAASTAAPAPFQRMTEDELGAAMVALAKEEGHRGKTPGGKRNAGKNQRYRFTRELLTALAAAPPRRLKTLRLDGAVPEPGSDVTVDGRTVGTLTSPTDSPLFGVIALAVLDREVAENGTSVMVGDTPASVAELSIFDPDKRKPRA